MAEGNTGPETPPQAGPTTPDAKATSEQSSARFSWRIWGIPSLLLEDGTRGRLSIGARSQTADLNGNYDVSFGLYQLRLKGGDVGLPGYGLVLIEETPDPNQQEPQRVVTPLGTTDEKGVYKTSLTPEQIRSLNGKKVQVLSPNGEALTESEIRPDISPRLIQLNRGMTSLNDFMAPWARRGY